MTILRQLMFLLVLFLVTGCGTNQKAGGLDAGGLDTEPGLRLRVYYIDEYFEAARPLQPGQFSNIDMTVTQVLATRDTVCQDKQAISAQGDKEIWNLYVAEWTGWIYAPDDGNYHFYRETEAQTTLTIGGKEVESDVLLEKGWHPFTLVQ